MEKPLPEKKIDMYVLRVIDDDCGLLHHQGSVFSFEMRGPLPSMKLRRILRLPPPAARLLDAFFFLLFPTALVLPGSGDKQPGRQPGAAANSNGCVHTQETETETERGQTALARRANRTDLSVKVGKLGDNRTISISLGHGVTRCRPAASDR